MFIPLDRMIARTLSAKDDSDTSYFLDLLYLGEFVLKIMVLEAAAGIEKTPERHRYAIEYNLIRADSIGTWTSTLEEALRGPASQHYTLASRDSLASWTEKHSQRSDSWVRAAVEALAGVADQVDATHDFSPARKVSLEDWSKTFVAIRNRTRGHGAPRSTKIADACILLEKSITLVTTNAPAFNRSWAYLKRSLSGKYRVSQLGGDRSLFSYLTSESHHTLDDGVYIYLDKPVHTRLAQTDVDLSDFFVPNGNYRNGKMEYFSPITDARLELIDEKFTIPVEARRASETSATPEMEVIGETFTNMPAKQVGYVDRDELQTELLRLLGDTRNPVITLKGRGGVGKTSLALHVLHEIAQKPEFFSIIWFSARDVDLLTVGPKVVRPDVLSLDDVAKDLWRLIKPGLKYKQETGRQHLAECLAGESPDGPFLLVFDNFETIREPIELYNFVNNSVRIPNKVLITTRSADFRGDYPIDVGGMTRSQYRILTEEVSALLGIKDLVDESYQQELYEQSDGHPYITKVLLGEVATSRTKSNLKRVIASQDNLLNALFERSFSALSAAGQRVFLLLCSWRARVPKLALEAVILRPVNERIDTARAIQELETFSLVERSGPSSSDRFISVPLAASLFGKKKLVTSPMRSAIEADLQFVQAFGSNRTGESFKDILPRIRRFGKYIAELQEQGRPTDQALSVLEYIANDYAPAWLVLSDFYEESNDDDAAIAATRRFLQETPDDRTAWRKLIRLSEKSGYIRDEVSSSVSLAEMTRDIVDISNAMNIVNRVFAKRDVEFDADERGIITKKLRSLMEPELSKAGATDLSRLAWICVSDRDIEAARRYVELGLQLDPGNSHCESLAVKLKASDLH
ncbi:tetratricopeptide repeat protein [Rhodococcoides fascians]|uniref:tetratricopeptide repeat protein n=1 Tax=Rhodococcoides fascians TaxID=1828 RepID=UPI000A5DE6B7|nr:tetratricopeptide repeat protein [Rhodococcus fascians]